MFQLLLILPLRRSGTNLAILAGIQKGTSQSIVSILGITEDEPFLVIHETIDTSKFSDVDAVLKQITSALPKAECRFILTAQALLAWSPAEADSEERTEIGTAVGNWKEPKATLRTLVQLNDHKQHLFSK